MEVKTVMGNQIRSGCSFCSCENCRYDANSCAGVCGYHANLVKPTFEFESDWFREDIDILFRNLKGDQYEK